MGILTWIIIFILIILALNYFFPEKAPEMVDKTFDGLKAGAGKIGRIWSFNDTNITIGE